MPHFSYIAQTDSGSIQRGCLDAPTETDVQSQLSDRGWRLIGIDKTRVPIAGIFRRMATMNRPVFSSVRSADAELLLQQLAVMLESGLALAPSLRELSIHSPNQRTRQLCNRLGNSVEQGESFTTAIEGSAAFPTVVAQLTRIGEASGELSLTLRRAAEFMEQRRQALVTMLSTLAYPLVVALAASSVAIYLVGWAIPKLAIFLNAMGRRLPTMTQSLLDLSAIVQTYGPSMVVFTVSGIITLGLCYVWRPGRYRIDQCLLRIPVLGRLLQTAETQQLASSLSLLIRNGVALQDALGTAATLNRNQYLAGQVLRSQRRISMGHDLAGSLRDRGFAPLLPSMIAVGERTGELSKTLDHVSDFYNKQIESQLKRFGRLIEPTIIVVVGGMVGYVYIAFFMALMSAGGNF